MSLEATETECAANATAPRVSLADIEAAIDRTYFTTADRAVEFAETSGRPLLNAEVKGLGLLTLCLVVMRNGFIVIGKSAPASPDNFNAELGRKLAYEDAIRQLWPLMGFALRERLAAGEA